MEYFPNFNTDSMRHVTWQYDSSERLIDLIESKTGWYAENGEKFIRGWNNDIFNLKTASRFGCLIWALILNIPVSMVYQRGEIVDAATFGFGNGRKNFDNGNFFTSLDEFDSPALSLEDSRRILRIRYYAQTISPTIRNVNEMLRDVFSGEAGRSPAYVTENQARPMVQTYRFSFTIAPNFRLALLRFLPRGSGVSTVIISA